MDKSLLDKFQYVKQLTAAPIVGAAVAFTYGVGRPPPYALICCPVIPM